MGIACFWVELSGLSRIKLRRYRSNSEERCPADDNKYSYCEAGLVVGTQLTRFEEFADRKTIALVKPSEYATAPWPQTCEKCGKPFDAHDTFQVHQDVLYQALDGREWAQRDLPVGAMFDAFWLNDIPRFTGPDGKALICIVPGGHAWAIDSQANNCTRPDEPHKCWIRHGVPPLITVDKAGDTCAAGGGSILTKDWHGWLRNGELVEC